MSTHSKFTKPRVLRAGLAALTLACALAGLPAVASAGPTATTVTIEAQEGGFFGYVKSRKEACEYNRTLALYKQTGSKRNLRRDRKIGTDKPQPNGPDSMWSISVDGGGRFYAYVKATATCAAAYSKTISAQKSTSALAGRSSASAPFGALWTIRSSVGAAQDRAREPGLATAPDDQGAA